MSFESHVTYLSPVDDAKTNDYTFTVGITYEDPGVTPETIEIYRFISESMFSEFYIPYGSPVPFKYFEKVKELILSTGPGYITFTNQIEDDDMLRKEIFKTKARYVAYAIFNDASTVFNHTPYVVTSFSESGAGAFSSSTQVLHNILHLENENIWWNKPSGYDLNLSEMSQDLLRAYLNRHHHGVEGIGGLAWVVNRLEEPLSVSSFFPPSSSSSSVSSSSVSSSSLSSPSSVSSSSSSFSSLSDVWSDKYLVGGYFTEIGGETYWRIARINADGTVDGTFSNLAVNNYVRTITPTSDDKYLVGGDFTEIGGATYERIARINADGTVDGTFSNLALNGSVRTITPTSDDKYLVGGYFTAMGGEIYERIARINADGTVDGTFSNLAVDKFVYTITPT